MARIGVITKSFAPDFELCAALNRSVLENTPDTVLHHIIVPRSDHDLFSRLATPRTRIRYEDEFLPRTFVRMPFFNISINLSRPFPPVRGWILQQVVKLAAIAASEDDAALVVDSDVEFIRPFSADTFINNGNVRFYCKPNELDERLPRHMTWHRVARKLLGLPAAAPPYSDYISSPLAWNPVIVRQMLARVEATTRRPWPTAIAGLIDFSECVLYGVFVENVVGSPANLFVSDDALCLSYWEHSPLDARHAAEFVRGVRPADIAVMIPSKSQTPSTIRDTVRTALRTTDRSQKPPGNL